MGSALPIADPAPRSGLLPEGVTADPATPFGVYLHVPFCRVRCGYCDFNTYTATELRGARQDTYADTLIQEITMSAPILAAAGPLRPAQTVFIGGGTPTLLPAEDLGHMLGAVRGTFGVTADAEVTVEANPDTVTDDLAQRLREDGVTRLSIGMQSSVPHVLAALDRTHDPRNIATAVAAAKRAGLAVSLDLIYGAPGESLADWQHSVQTALALEPDHISAYALIVEDGTKLARQIRRGEVPAPDDDLQADMYEFVDDALAEAGYAWYEISNWAKTAQNRSRHNLSYWTGADWWGYGPGAHSHVGGVRWWNVKHPAAYAALLAQGASPGAGREHLSVEAQRTEAILLRSRIADGLDIAFLTAAQRTHVAALIADGLVEPAPALRGRIVLTRRGRLLADTVVHALTDRSDTPR